MSHSNALARVLPQVSCARCDGSLGEALVFSTSAKARAAAAKAGAATRDGQPSASGQELGDIDGGDGDPDAARAGEAPAAGGGRKQGVGGSSRGRGAKGRAFHSRRQRGHLNVASGDDDVWGVGCGAGSVEGGSCGVGAAGQGGTAAGQGQGQGQGQGGSSENANSGVESVLPASVEGLGAPGERDPDLEYARKASYSIGVWVRV